MAQTHQEIIRQIKKAIDNQSIPPHYNPSEWTGKNFNCYAYALRACFDFNEKIKKKGVFPRPSFISSVQRDVFKITKKHTLEYLKKDCEALGLQLFPAELDEQIDDNEYKIAVYVKTGYDYHFARQDSDGNWSEKNGWDDGIEVLKKEDVVKSQCGYKFVGIFEVAKKAE